MKKKYVEEVAPALMTKFQYESVMQIPKIEKIVVSVGCGDCKDNAKALDAVIKDITAITGQKAVATVAKKSVANFKLREGMHVGVKVTLRQDRMWEFLDRLFNIALPRVRDFRGISADAFDGRGNYSLGLKEQIIFPEIEYDKIEKLRGMNIAIITTAKTDEEARELLKITVLKNSGLTAREACGEIVSKTGSEPVQCIGNKFVIYKKSRKHQKIFLD